MDQTSTGGGLLSQPELTPLEQEVLDEYERLAENMNKVRLLSRLNCMNQLASPANNSY